MAKSTIPGLSDTTFFARCLRTLKLTVASLRNTLRHLDVCDYTAVNFPTKELFLARIMSLRAHTTHDNKPSNLMAAQWNKARVMNARGREVIDQKKNMYYLQILSHFAISSFKHAPFILLPEAYLIY